MKLHIMNPQKRRRRTGKRKVKPVARKKTAKRTGRKRRRRRNPAPNPTRRRSTRRRSSRRRRNPALLGGLTREFSDFLPRLAGKLTVAYVVQRYGSMGQLFGGSPVQSQTAGTSWTFGQYVLAYLVAVYGSKLFGRVLNGAKFREGAMDLIMTKFIWTEGIARSDWARAQFGAPQVAYSPRTGQTWIAQGGQYSAMQGAMGDGLVTASPLDGLVEASPLDGPYGSSFGHLVAADTLSPKKLKNARYSGTAYRSNYNAAYSQ